MGPVVEAVHHNHCTTVSFRLSRQGLDSHTELGKTERSLEDHKDDSTCPIVLGTYRELRDWCSDFNSHSSSYTDCIRLWAFLHRLGQTETAESRTKLVRRAPGAWRCQQSCLLRVQDGYQILGGCGKCFWCRKERKVKRLKRLLPRIERRCAEGKRTLFVTLTLRAGLRDRLTPKALSKAASDTFEAIVRSREGRGCSAWTGLVFKYLRAPGVTKAGVVHFHALVWPQGEWPGLEAVRREMQRLFNKTLAKTLGIEGNDFTGDHQIGGVHISPCRNTIKAARYICLSQESENNRLPKAVRVAYSRDL